MGWWAWRLGRQLVDRRVVCFLKPSARWFGGSLELCSYLASIKFWLRRWVYALIPHAELCLSIDKSCQSHLAVLYNTCSFV